MVFLEPRIEHSTNEVGLLAVKEAVANNTPVEAVRITARHFRQAIDNNKNIKI